VGNYLVVKQHDAHAWTEVWLKEEGWRRVDPTAAVSPARIKEGIENALPGSLIDIPLALQNSKMARDIWKILSNNLDAINNRWNQWVLGYNNQRQNRFLTQMGFRDIDWREMTGWLFMLSILVLLAVAFYLFKADRSQTDEARRLYDNFCSRLAHCGIPRIDSEGPADFARRSGKQRRDLAEQIKNITELYIASRYQDRKALLVSLRQQIKLFKPDKLNKI